MASRHTAAHTTSRIPLSDRILPFFLRADGAPEVDMRHPRYKGHVSALLVASLLLCPAPAPAQDYVGNGNVTISGGSWDTVYGLKGQPRSGNALADGARLTISGGAVNSDIYGGYARSDSGTARAGGNTVIITGLSGNPGTIYGGYARSLSNAVASGNTLTISGSLALTNLFAYGGRATTRGGSNGLFITANNRLTIDTTADFAQVFGGSVDATSNVNSQAGSYGNIVTVNRGSIAELFGGKATGDGPAESSGNTVAVAGGNVTYLVGAAATSFAQGAVADGNVVSVTGGTHETVIAASVQSNKVLASASNNAVYLSHTTVTDGVTGGLSTSTDRPSNLNHNNVVVGAGAVVNGDIHGGDANQTGTSGNTADYNTIAVVNGGQVDGELVGGNLTGTGSASHNTILVNNGSVTGNIIGGRTATGGSATGNNIIIGRQARLATSINLFGGEVDRQVVAARGSGNTLFVDSWQGTVNRAAGFANLHFVLPAPGTAATGVPMLTVAAAEAGDFDGTTVTAQLPDIITGGRAHIGETFELVHDASGAVAKADTGRLVSLLQGYAAVYDGIILKDATSIYLRIGDRQVNPLAGALTEARIGAAGLLNQGGDLLAGAALRAADEAARERTGWAAFAVLYGGGANLTTQTDISMQGMSLVTGLAQRSETAWADVLLGAFLEMGSASLTTSRDVAGTTVAGNGDAHYTGGGLLARLDLTRGLLRGLYVEADGRAGEANASWYSDDLRDNLDRPAAYDLATPYYGGHVGLGYVLPLNDDWTLDVYGKYLFLHQDGQDTAINGDRFRFDPVDSGRLRCGARLSGSVIPSAAVYLGAAWEREFFGTARAASLSSDMPIPSTSMAGDSAVLELGMAIHPAATPIHLDLALEGAVGTRRAIGGRVQLVYEF